jgi:hypothetical protein
MEAEDMNNKKIWYVVVDAKGIKKYRYCKTKKAAEQLKKNIDNIIDNNKVLTWVDFIWTSDFIKYPANVLHGKEFTKTTNIINDIGYYMDNMAI